MAVHLARLETAIRSSGTSQADLPQLAQQQQGIYMKLVQHPGWINRFISLLPSGLRNVARDNYTAIRQIRTLNGVRSSLPHWRIVQPPDPGLLLAYYQDAQARYGVPWQYLAAIHLIETSMSRIQGTSTAGALGPMQFMPSTWTEYGQGSVYSPHDAILAAARYLRSAGAPRNMNSAIYSYNNSWLYVQAVEDYAGIMHANPRAFYGYYYWQVYVLTNRGDVLLPAGFRN
jgi:hypothetical protein